MILVDGQPDTSGLADDRGLAYGDGLFETIAVRAGMRLAWDAHLTRLLQGCVALDIPPPDTALLDAECMRVVGSGTDGVLKIIITRGSGGRGYRSPATPVARRIVALHPWPAQEPAEQGAPGVRSWICAHRLGSQPALAGLKHLNRLDQVLASREWPGDDYQEGLMLDHAGHLVEGTRSNLFLVRDGRVSTPALTDCGVHGIVRAAVMAWCRHHAVALQERALPLAALGEADEIFICNSIIGIRAVTYVHGAPPIERPAGTLTATIRAALRAQRCIA